MKYRRIIFYAFLILFLISTPFILLYANGYRYNAKKNKFEKTGGLIVNTITKDVSLFINGRLYGNGDKFRIQNLLPGEYEVSIFKSGYFDWQKKLSVESKITTFAKDVRLIANNLPTKTADGSFGAALYPAPNMSKFLYVKTEKDANSVFIFDTTSDTEKSIASLSLRQTIKNIAWSPNNEKIILETSGGFQVINASDGKTQALPLKTIITGLRWDEAGGADLFAGTADGIYKIDFLLKKAEKIYSPAKNTISFAVYQNNLYLLSQSALQQINLSDKSSISVSLLKNSYKIHSVSYGRLVLIDTKEHMQIFSLPLQKSGAPQISADAKNFDISGNNLLYYNDFELWTHNFGTGEKELITRFGEEIKKARWLSGSDYIAINFGKQIKIIELDKRDARQIYSFPRFEQIGDFLVNKKYSLYFSGKVNEASGIYKSEF